MKQTLKQCLKGRNKLTYVSKSIKKFLYWIGKPIATTHVSKYIKKSLYWLESIIHKETIFLHFSHIRNRILFDFKHVFLSRPDELVSLPHITRKVQMSTFQPNWNISGIPFVDLNIVQTVDEGLDRKIRQYSFSNFDNLK